MINRMKLEAARNDEEDAKEDNPSNSMLLFYL